MCLPTEVFAQTDINTSITYSNEYELYDLETDPNEMHNLYGDPEYAELTSHLRAGLEELRKETNDRYVYKPPKLLGRQVNHPEDCNC